MILCFCAAVGLPPRHGVFMRRFRQRSNSLDFGASVHLGVMVLNRGRFVCRPFGDTSIVACILIPYFNPFKQRSSGDGLCMLQVRSSRRTAPLLLSARSSQLLMYLMRHMRGVNPIKSGIHSIAGVNGVTSGEAHLLTVVVRSSKNCCGWWVCGIWPCHRCSSCLTISPRLIMRN